RANPRREREDRPCQTSNLQVEEGQMLIVPLVASLVSFVFSLLLLRQYTSRHRPYQLVWSVALLMFSLAALAETLATPFSPADPAHWNEIYVKIYYIFGGTLVVGYLALGTLYLSDERSGAYLLGFSALLTFALWLPVHGPQMLTGEEAASGIIISGVYTAVIAVVLALRRATPKIYLGALIIITVAAAALVIPAAVDPSLLVTTKGWEALERTRTIRSMAFSLNVLGTFVLVFGALQSAWVVWRRKMMPERAIANALIAVGVIIVAGGGTVGGLFGLGGQAAISAPMAVGILVMFLGFLRAGKQPVKKA
ncbi:MAG: hypothetical protein ACE5E0_03740, partial [Terriglobia bacterium]